MYCAVQAIKDFGLTEGQRCVVILPDSVRNYMWVPTVSNGLSTLPDSDSDSYFKLNSYIALCRSFHTVWSQIQIPIPTANYRNGIGIRVCTRVRLPQCKSAIRSLSFSFSKIFFLWGHSSPSCGLLVTSALGFKARVNPSLLCFVTCTEWNPQIHLWYDTCWPTDSQYGSVSRPHETKWLHWTKQKFSHCTESDSDSIPNCQPQEWDLDFESVSRNVNEPLGHFLFLF